MLTASTIRYLTDIFFDFGAVKVLPDLLKKFHISHPLVITDKGLINLGIIESDWKSGMRIACLISLLS